MTTAADLPVKYAGRNYVIEMALAALIYAGTAWARPWLIAQAPNHDLVIAATVLPALPVWAMLIVVWRYYRRIDEFERLRFLETIAISFGIGSCLICTYAFLADAGLPELAITWAWPTLAVSWALTGGIMHIARR